MSKRAMRLHQKYTRAELVAMQKAILSDPHYQLKDPNSIHLLTKDGQRLHDDIGWAIYWYDAPKGNTRMQTERPQTKNW